MLEFINKLLGIFGRGFCINRTVCAPIAYSFYPSFIVHVTEIRVCLSSSMTTCLYTTVAIQLCIPSFRQTRWQSKRPDTISLITYTFAFQNCTVYASFSSYIRTNTHSQWILFCSDAQFRPTVPRLKYLL